MGLLLGVVVPEVAAQQIFAPLFLTPPSLGPKVWTNEDLVELRTPPDIYLDEEIRLRQEAEAGAAVASSTDAKHSLLPVETPKTIEEADRFIADKYDEIDSQETSIKAVKEKLDHAGPEEVEHLQTSMKQLTTDLEATKRELKALLLIRRELTKNPSATSTTAREGAKPQ